MDKVYGIYGAGGFGREVLPLLRQQIKNTGKIYFIVDNAEDNVINGVPVVSFDTFCMLDAKFKYFTVAIADRNIRVKLNDKCQSHNLLPVSIFAHNAIVMDEVDIADGAILAPFTCITSNVKIGKSFHANLYSYIAHDCIIGDYVTFAPGVKCNGNVHIEDYAYIGTGAIIRPGTKDAPLIIGAGAIIGMGAVVTKSVPAGKTVFGNPAKLLGK